MRKALSIRLLGSCEDQTWKLIMTPGLKKYIFSQFIYHVILDVLVNQNLYQERVFLSVVRLKIADVHHCESKLYQGRVFSFSAALSFIFILLMSNILSILSMLHCLRVADAHHFVFLFWPPPHFVCNSFNDALSSCCWCPPFSFLF